MTRTMECGRLLGATDMDAFQRILENARVQRIPLSAHFELTYRCNLDCAHCYATQRRQPGELTARESIRVLDELACAGCLFLCLTGGEIFCRSDLIPFLRAAKERSFALRLLTNGTLLTPSLADELADVCPLAVEISLYAMDPAIHDSITTVPGSHALTLAAINLCLERGLNVAIKTVLLKANVMEFPALRAFASENGTRFVHDLLLAPSDDGADIMRESGLSEDELAGFFQSYGAVPPATNFQALRPLPDDPLCGQAASTVAVGPSGDVFPCLAIRRPMGNLKTTPFREIWNASGLVSCANMRYSDLKECGKCAFFDYCIRCPGLAWAQSGDIAGCSGAACRIARAQKRAWGGERME